MAVWTDAAIIHNRCVVHEVPTRAAHLERGLGASIAQVHRGQAGCCPHVHHILRRAEVRLATELARVDDFLRCTGQWPLDQLRLADLAELHAQVEPALIAGTHGEYGLAVGGEYGAGVVSRRRVAQLARNSARQIRDPNCSGILLGPGNEGDALSIRRPTRVELRALA